MERGGGMERRGGAEAEEADGDCSPCCVNAACLSSLRPCGLPCPVLMLVLGPLGVSERSWLGKGGWGLGSQCLLG